MELYLVSEFFLTGLILSWGPCLSHCALIIFPYILSTEKSLKNGVISGISFSFGRTIAYILIGIIAGLSGKLFTSIYMAGDLKYYLELSGGIFLFLIGIIIISGKLRSFKVCKIFERHNFKSAFSLGFVLGIVPCVPLMGIFIYMILKTSSIFEGFIYGLSFGIGTFISPIIIIAGFAGSISDKILKNEKAIKIIQIVSGIIILFFSIRIIYPLIK